MSFLQLPARKHFLSTMQATECAIIVNKDKLTDRQQCHRRRMHASNSGDMTTICLQTRSATLIYLQRILRFPLSRNSLQSHNYGTRSQKQISEDMAQEQKAILKGDYDNILQSVCSE
jgi:hypothetical protein